MASTKWVHITMDRRGSLFIPTQIKQGSGYQPGTIFFLRALGDALVLLPMEEMLARGVANGSDHQKDGALAVYLNEAWNGTPHAVAPPLFERQAAAPARPEDQSTEADGFRHMVEMNKKGFIPIPDTVKTALGTRIGDKFLVEVRWNAEKRPVIMIEPMIHQGALDAYLEKKKLEHLADMQREARQATLVRQITTLREEVQELEQRRKVLVEEIKQKRLAGPVSTFKTMLDAPAKPHTATLAAQEQEAVLSLQATPRDKPLDLSHLPDCFPGKIKAPTVRTTVHAPGHPLHEFEVEDNAVSEQLYRELFPGAIPMMHVPVPGIPQLVPPVSPTHAPVSTAPLIGPDGKLIPVSSSTVVLHMDPTVLQEGNVWRDDPFFGRIQVPDDRDKE